MTRHVPILNTPILEMLAESLIGKGPAWLIDCTLGGGGHTSAFIDKFNADPAAFSDVKILGVDRDADVLARAGERFKTEVEGGRLELLHSSFSAIAEEVTSRPTYAVLADLGFSSDQLDDPSRGLSFQADGPLDMRLDPSQGPTCRDLLVRLTERELEKILVEYGEERFARRIAEAIVLARRARALPQTTKQLADLILKAVPPTARHGRIHAATRTFQALRIAVNDELGELDSLLSRVILGVREGGRIAILSFHSLEDRRVKQAFKKDGFEPLTKKPIEADEDEVRRNVRARSAKLRVAVRS